MGDKRDYSSQISFASSNKCFGEPLSLFYSMQFFSGFGIIFSMLTLVEKNEKCIKIYDKTQKFMKICIGDNRAKSRGRLVQW